MKIKFNLLQVVATTAGNVDAIQYDVPKTPHKRSQSDVNFEVI